MSKILAIKGDKERGNEVIALLEMLGGDNRDTQCRGIEVDFYYYIDTYGRINYEDCFIEDEAEFFTLDEFYNKYPYKVGDIVKTGKDEEGVIKQMRWVNNDIVYWANSHKTCDWTQTLSVDVLDKYNRLNSNNTVKENNMETYKGTEYDGYENVKKVAYLSINNKEYADEIEVNLGDDYEYKFEMNRLYILKKKPKYPTTYEECWKVRFEVDGETTLEEFHNVSGYYSEPLGALQKLLCCRDAYWKIAGEEMGLGEIWKPSYIEESFEQGSPIKYVLYYTGTHIAKERRASHYLLSFPTEEMRDAFYENFKVLIEQCKELL